MSIERVSGYTTSDGTLFSDVNEALEYEYIEKLRTATGCKKGPIGMKQMMENADSVATVLQSLARSREKLNGVKSNGKGK